MCTCVEGWEKVTEMVRAVEKSRQTGVLEDCRTGFSPGSPDS